jgi:hypothetical protein
MPKDRDPDRCCYPSPRSSRRRRHGRGRRSRLRGCSGVGRRERSCIGRVCADAASPMRESDFEIAHLGWTKSRVPPDSRQPEAPRLREHRRTRLVDAHRSGGCASHLQEAPAQKGPSAETVRRSVRRLPNRLDRAGPGRSRSGTGLWWDLRFGVRSGGPEAAALRMRLLGWRGAFDALLVCRGTSREEPDHDDDDQHHAGDANGEAHVVARPTRPPVGR